MGHQAGKLTEKQDKLDMMNWLEKLEYDLLELPRPDIVLFLYMPYQYSVELRNKREEVPDGAEKDVEHLKNAEATYSMMAEKYNYNIIYCVKDDKIRTIEEIHEDVYNIVKEKLGQLINLIFFVIILKEVKKMFDLRLDEDIFEIVKNGTKRVEIRLYDEKRKNIKNGDTLTFIKRPLLEEKIDARITGLHRFKNIEELLNKYEMKEIYIEDFDKTEFIKLLSRFYSKEEQEKYGFVAIEFEVL